MTKRDFIDKVKTYGYVNWKDVLVEMGRGKRNLDRFKYEDNLIDEFVADFDKWEKAQTQKKGKPKIEQKEKPTTPTIKKEIKPIKTPKKDDKTIGIDITNEEYHASDNLGSSKIKLIFENAKEYYHKYILKDADRKETDALIVGKLHHTLVLEPYNFDRDYILAGLPSYPVKQDYVEAIERLGGGVNTKVNGKGETTVSDTVAELKEKYAKLIDKNEKTLITQAQLDIAKITSRKALDSRFVVEASGKVLLDYSLEDLIQYDKCYVEKTFYGEINGHKIQVRPDMLINLSKEGDYWYVVDLKTAIDATMQSFSTQSAKFYYDIQEYIYTEILRQNGILVREFRFNVTGKTENSGCEYYQLSKGDIEDAEKMVSKILEKYTYCKENDIWREGNFDYNKMRFEPVALVQMPTWRKFRLQDMGVL